MKPTAIHHKSPSQNKKLPWGLILSATAIVLTIVGGAFYFGKYFEGNKFDTEKNNLNDQNQTLKAKLDSAAKENKILGGAPAVMINGSLSPGFGMGVDSYEQKRDWVKKIGDAQVMAFPGSAAWGAMFVTVGPPVPRSRRKSADFSGFHTLSVELKGTKGESVDIGMKSPTDNDDGSETKQTVVLENDGWNTYTYDLTKFETADLSHLYVVMEFVFDTKPETISVRNITFNK
jgi:hypothetical protein